MVAILKTEGLTKHFGAFKAVQDLNLEVREGDLYGFLGPNGSGKTTSMRMILRLIRPTSGRVLLFGEDIASNFIGIMQKVGALVELPAYYPYLTAVQNLEILRLVSGGVPASRIPEVLETVGLGPRMHSRVRTYSQGMRQRLGIAMALLTKPRLVFLDEPTNGLDPQGINHMREVIQELNRKDGVTFVISSHLLHEVELTCTRIGMIKQGKLIVQDKLDAIIARTVDGLRIACDPTAKAISLLADRDGIVDVKEESPGRLRVVCDPARFAQVNTLLVENGVTVSELTPARKSLEEFFLSQ
ncbi:MAG: ABC transporter ATP-binding protein [Planctomycetaceae bacterium]|nr:ABC transporter ATP-binding protein [Planctomycetaceae bacterium]